MSRVLRRLIPSPAMIVALVALVMSLGGSAYALVITGKSIRNNSVFGRDIHNHSLTGVDVRADKLGGGAIKESSLGTVPGALSAVAASGLGYWAVVNQNGVLVRGRGFAAGDPAARTGEGIYHVIFNRDVRGCAYVASVGSPTVDAVPPGGEVHVASHPTNVNAVRVRTTNDAGVALNRPFHLAVTC
jgi:hypothetical protein